MNFWTQLISEGNGSPSTMRVATLVIVLAVMVTWSVTSIQKGAMQPLSLEQIGLVLGVLGVKAYQRTKENGVAKAINGNGKESQQQ